MLYLASHVAFSESILQFLEFPQGLAGVERGKAWFPPYRH